MADRAVLFIDGNNRYHALSNAGVPDLGRLDYAKISEKRQRVRPLRGHSAQRTYEYDVVIRMGALGSANGVFAEHG